MISSSLLDHTGSTTAVYFISSSCYMCPGVVFCTTKVTPIIQYWMPGLDSENFASDSESYAWVFLSPASSAIGLMTFLWRLSFSFHCSSPMQQPPLDNQSGLSSNIAISFACAPSRRKGLLRYLSIYYLIYLFWHMEDSYCVQEGTESSSSKIWFLIASQ